ncbi:MAG: hypothetical protein EXS09_02720 [Gemmataceae bacterium]|nr:hypothetical protein [Gemmataceae bacterium]
MKIQVRCPSCSAEMAVPEVAAGKRVRCLRCKTVVKVPAATPKAAATDSDYDVDVLPDLSEKKPRSRRERSQSDRARDEDYRPKKLKSTDKKSKSPALLLILVVVFGIVAVGGGLSCYFLFWAKSKSLQEPLASGSGTTNQPTRDEELYKALSGTQWAWGQGVEFQTDMNAVNADWKTAGFTMRWDPIDRRTVVVNLERGRGNNRLAVLTFSDDLKQFNGYEFERLNRLNIVNRKGEAAGAPWIDSARAASVAELKRDLAKTKWNWGDAELTLEANGIVNHLPWNRANMITFWEAIDRRTAVLKLEVGRVHDRFAVLRFSEDLSQFTGYDFGGGRMPPKPRVLAPTTSPSPKIPGTSSPSNPALAAAKKKMIGKWVADKNLAQMELTADGRYKIWERLTPQAEWKESTSDDEPIVWDLIDATTFRIFNVSKSGERFSRSTRKITKLTDTELELASTVRDDDTDRYSRAE